MKPVNTDGDVMRESHCLECPPTEINTKKRMIPVRSQPQQQQEEHDSIPFIPSLSSSKPSHRNSLHHSSSCSKNNLGRLEQQQQQQQQQRQRSFHHHHGAPSSKSSSSSNWVVILLFRILPVIILYCIVVLASNVYQSNRTLLHKDENDDVNDNQQREDRNNIILSVNSSASTENAAIATHMSHDEKHTSKNWIGNDTSSSLHQTTKSSSSSSSSSLTTPTTTAAATPIARTTPTFSTPFKTVQSTTEPTTTTSSSSTTTCHRRCSNEYRNRIVLTNTGLAGLNDRMYIIYTLMQLAGYLCAKVVVPRPAFMLSPHHNINNASLDPRMPWTEFGQFVYYFTKQQAPATTSVAEIALIDWWDQVNMTQLPNVTKLFFQNPKYQDWWHMTTMDPSHMVTDLIRVEQWSFQDHSNNNNNHHHRPTTTGFIWQIDTNLYDWEVHLSEFLWQRKQESPNATAFAWIIHNHNNHTTNHESFDLFDTRHFPNVSSSWRLIQPMLHRPSYLYKEEYWACEYGKIEPTIHAQQMQSKILQQVLQTSNNNNKKKKNQSDDEQQHQLKQQPIIGYFHIRRGDTMHECNTTLERVEEYLNCSFDTWRSYLATSALTKQQQQSSIHSQRKQREKGQASEAVVPNTNFLQANSMIVLFSSDERNAQYRQSVAKLIRQQGQQLQQRGAHWNHRNSRTTTKAKQDSFVLNVDMIDLDLLVQNLVQDEIQSGKAPQWRWNNFYLYQIVYQLSYNASVVHVWLERRRGFGCPNCTNMTQQIIQNLLY